MTDNEKIHSFGDMVEATRKLTKPWIIALITTNVLWAAVTFALVWFAYMAPIEVEQAQDFPNQTQAQTYSQNATQGDWHWLSSAKVYEVAPDDLEAQPALDGPEGGREAEGGDGWLNSQHRTIRALLQSMAPKRAISYIKAFGLPPEEELFVVECDVRGKSYIQAAQEHNVSPETIKRRRKSAYSKIADELNNAKEEDRGI